MPQPYLRRGLLACFLAAAVWACEEVAPTGGGAGTTTDDIPPTVSIVLADSLIDINEGLQFTVTASDNISLLTIGWAVSGAVTKDTLITFTTTTRTFAGAFTITEGFTGGQFTIIASAVDGAGNVAMPDTATASVFDALAPTQTLISPVAGDLFNTGSTMDVVVNVADPSGVQQIIGELFSRDRFSQPVVIAADTTNIATPPFPTAIEDTLSFTIPNALLPGTYEVRTFAADGAAPSRTGFSTPVNVSVLDGIAPGGSFISPPVDSLVIAGDPIPVRFRATDLTGVDSVVFTAAERRGVDSLGTAEFIERYLSKTAIIDQSRDTSIIRILDPVLSDSTAAQVTITGTVYDVGGTGTSVTTTIQVVPGPTVSILSPAEGDVLPVGVPITVDLLAASPDGVARMIATASGAVTDADTASFNTLLQIRPRSLTIDVPADAPLGTVTITPLARDGSSRIIPGEPVTITLADLVAPTLQFIEPDTGQVVRAGDSLQITFDAQDNKGIVEATFNGVSHRGNPLKGTDTVVTRFIEKTISLDPAATDTMLMRWLNVVTTDSTAETVYMRVTLRDSSGNITADSVPVSVVDGPTVAITSPTDSTHPVGTDISVGVSAFSPDEINLIYVLAEGVFSGTDTVSLTAPFSQTVDTSLTLTVPTDADLGEVTIFAFATDTIGTVIPSDTIVLTLTDEQAPGITIILPDSAFLVRTRDSVRLEVQVTDNKGVALVTVDGVAHRGNLTLGTDTVVTRFDPKEVELDQIPDTTLLRDLLSTEGDETAETAYVRVIAQDSSGNTTRDSVLIEVIQGPALSITLPADSSVVAPDKSISVTVRGEADTGIKKIGYTTTGVLSLTDTTTILPTTNPQVEDTSLTFTLTVPDTTTLGFFTINPFGRDSLGNVGTGPSIVVEIIASGGASDADAPLVTDSLDLRTESDDTIKVRATDVGGITRIGFFTIDLGTGDTLSGDSTDYAGTSTDISELFEIGLDTVTRFPLEVYVTAFAVDSVGNRGVLSQTSVALAPVDGETADTVTLVAGHTVPLPDGGLVADAIYNRNNDKVYLTNPLLDQVEVFDIPTTAFETGIPVGSRPWGIGLWPVDTLGTHGDTIVVANSGGTNISIVDVSGAAFERRRHALPNFEIHLVTTDPEDIATSNGRLRTIIGIHDFSDRPQFLGMVCRTTSGGSDNCARDSVLAVYSTTPTIDQGEIFPNRGSVRYENLTACLTTIATNDPIPTGEECNDGPWTAAAGFFTFTGDPTDGETITIDGVVYTFRTALTPAANEILIGPASTTQTVSDDISDTRNNFFHAIRGGEGAGTRYAATTTAHPTVTAYPVGNYTAVIEYDTLGTSGNGVATTTDFATAGAWGSGTLSGGTGTANPESHFFWEHAAEIPGEGKDTLEVWLVRGRDTTSLLAPARTETVDFDKMSFRDTTYVRNSGNFVRAFIGEGGDVGDDAFARVVAYDASVGTFSTNDTLIILSDTSYGGVYRTNIDGVSITDAGLSPGIEVRDFISNTATVVRSIGVNFNGLTNVVRADSIYVLNKFLRLTGIIGAPGENPGMDFNFGHDFNASERGTSGTDSTETQNRMLFAAREDPNIAVYDTWNFGLVATVPIKDPVIGPLRVAEDPVTNEQLLIGVTARGVVTVRLPQVTPVFFSPATMTPVPRR